MSTAGAVPASSRPPVLLSTSGESSQVKGKGRQEVPRQVEAERAQTDFRDLNANASMSLETYRQPNARDLATYTDWLAFNTDSLGPKNTVIDAGGGFGLASLELTHQTGARAVVINTQDTLGHLLQVREFVHAQPERALSLEKLPNGRWRAKAIAGMDPQWFRKLSRAVGQEDHSLRTHFATEGEAFAAVKTRVTETLDALQAKVDAGKFHVEAAFAEDALPALDLEANPLLDLWGAFSYSPKRVELLELYYGKLAQDGEAHVLVSRKVRTTVRGEDGNEQDLCDWLVERFPTVFTVTPAGSLELGRTLHMKRDPALSELHLGLETETLAYPWDGDFSVPELVLRETAPLQ